MHKEKKNEKDNDRKLLLLILLLLLITIVTASVSIYTIYFKEKQPVLIPDYAPVELEANAVSFGDEGEAKLDRPEGGGAVGLTYSKDVKISLSDKTATILFANPTKSNSDVVLLLMIDDTVCFKSGRITPGNKVLTMNLSEDIANNLRKGGYDGKFVVIYYDRVSGEKAMLSTEIPVVITVD